MKKTNPRKKPATGADVKKAWERGVHMADQIPKIWEAVCKLSEEVGEGMVSLSDLKHVLKTEYQVHI